MLITLGIIGIVAAMTLPALITRNQNKALEASLKKNYSVILQAFEMYQAEHGERLRPEILGAGGTLTGLKAQIMPYFKIQIHIRPAFLIMQTIQTILTGHMTGNRKSG